jgi:hypothetical protein
MHETLVKQWQGRNKVFREQSVKGPLSSPQILQTLIWNPGPGQLSLCSHLLRAGRSGDLISTRTRFFAPVQTGPGANPASSTISTDCLPGVKWPGRGVYPHPHLAPRFQKEKSCRAIHLLPLLAFVACSRVNLHFPFTVGSRQNHRFATP